MVLPNMTTVRAVRDLMSRTWTAQAHDIAEIGREAVAVELVAQTECAASALCDVSALRWLRTNPAGAMQLAMTISR